MNPQQLMLLRGAGPLPSAPQHPGVQLQQPGPVPQVGGTMPYQPSVSEQIMSGLGMLINSTVQSQERDKAQAAQEAQRDLQLLSLGVPVDQKKTLQRMKKAGIDLDFTGQSSPIGGQTPGMMTAPDPMQTPSQGQQAVIPQQQPIQPMQGGQPSLWGRMKEALGLGAQVAPNASSAPAQWLQQYAQRGINQQAFEADKLKHDRFKMGVETDVLASEQEKAKLWSRIFKGDREAYTQGKVSGLIKMTPFEEKVQAGIQGGLKPEDAQRRAMAMELGLDELERDMNNLAEKMLPQFGNDLAKARQYVGNIWQHGKSELKPQRSLDDELKVRKFSLDFMDNYPTVPQAVADVYANAIASGDTATAAKIMQKLSEYVVDPETKQQVPKFMTKGFLSALEKTEGMKDDKLRLKLQQRGLDLEGQRIAQADRHHKENYMLGLVGQMRANSNNMFDNAYRLWATKDASEEQKSEALQMMAAATQSMEPITIDIDGKKVTLATPKLEVKDVESIFNFISEPDKVLTLMGPIVKDEGRPKEPKTALEKFWDDLNKIKPGAAAGSGIRSPKVAGFR